MLKNKLDFKLFICLIIFLIIFIIYQTRLLWFCFFGFIINLLKPLLVSIMISYVCNLYLRKLNRIFNKFISVFIFFLTFFGIGYFIFFRMFPIIISQVIDCVNICVYFLKEFSIKYNFDVMDIYSHLDSFIRFLPNFNFADIFGSLFKYVSLGTVVFMCSIYLFLDWNKIFNNVKKICGKREKIYRYICILNEEIEKYTCSFLILSLLNVIEYSIIFMIAGHPNYLLLGVVAGLLSLIPVFGGMITNGLALLTAFVVNYGLFIRTLIGILVLSILDGYVVSPIVYSRGNKLHPLLIVLSIYIGSKLFGIFGVILSLPILIIVKFSFQFFQKKN